jgi:alkylhydroperoxidase family enzyme
VARIKGVPENSSPLTRVAYPITRRKVGRMVEPVEVAAHHPRLMLAMAAFEEAIGRSRRVPASLKALAELQAASHVGCPF